MNSSTNLTQSKAGKRKGKRCVKWIIIAVIILAVVIAAAKILPKVLGSKEVSTRIVTYNVTEVTVGSVTQTISGSGTLTPVTKKTATAQRGGEVKKVYYSVGDEVKKNAVIAVVGSTKIKAPCAGIIIELPVEKGDELSFNGTVATIMGKDGFTMNMSVDETEISLVKLEQEVTFSLEAVSGKYKGKVSKISYNGSTSGGSVNFQITAKLDHIDGVYPGMSASAEIVIEDSGEGILVPVEAVGTSGDDKYVYAAPAGAQKGMVYAEGELDLTALKKVKVETGMSDGTKMLVKSDELAKGSLIVVTKITSTKTGSDKDSDENRFSNMPGNFSDFNFGDFNPGQMPQGGGFSGGNFPGGTGGGGSFPRSGN